MDALRTVEHLAEGGIFTDELATKQDLGVMKAELKSEFKPDLAAVRNQVLATRAATFLGSLLYITFRL